ncbi:MAG: hypothetical protein KAR73_12925, partial [Spirochaetales bacterium]|nr:hypothetical protein [Spirochaetales bacterium]
PKIALLERREGGLVEIPQTNRPLFFFDSILSHFAFIRHFMRRSRFAKGGLLSWACRHCPMVVQQF